MNARIVRWEGTLIYASKNRSPGDAGAIWLGRVNGSVDMQMRAAERAAVFDIDGLGVVDCCTTLKAAS